MPIFKTGAFVNSLSTNVLWAFNFFFSFFFACFRFFAVGVFCLRLGGGGGSDL
jgi:hypothetical protein